MLGHRHARDQPASLEDVPRASAPKTESRVADRPHAVAGRGSPGGPGCSVLPLVRGGLGTPDAGRLHRRGGGVGRGCRERAPRPWGPSMRHGLQVDDRPKRPGRRGPRGDLRPHDQHEAERGHRSLPPYLPAGKSLEGFLFPQTYEFLAQGTSPGEVIDRLLQQFSTEADSLPWHNTEGLGVSPYEVVIIASMIERESRVPEDRPLIAAVIYNRLARGMALEIDATVAYIDPDPANGLTVSDFQIRSPYNTRLHSGLPPTPIASPGLASLQAALDPAKVGYLYYVLCGTDGHHVFSASYDRFLKDKARCLG